MATWSVPRLTHLCATVHCPLLITSGAERKSLFGLSISEPIFGFWFLFAYWHTLFWVSFVHS